MPPETIYYAAHQHRREIYCGGSSAIVILANKLAPRVADRYLARTGFSSQQMRGHPVPPDRPNNLFEPVPDKAATHGIFDAQAKDHSHQVWAPNIAAWSWVPLPVSVHCSLWPAPHWLVGDLAGDVPSGGYGDRGPTPCAARIRAARRR